MAWSLYVNESGLLNVMLVEGGRREIEGAAFIKIRIERVEVLVYLGEIMTSGWWIWHGVKPGRNCYILAWLCGCYGAGN